jgi:hypothetical protein
MNTAPQVRDEVPHRRCAMKLVDMGNGLRVAYRPAAQIACAQEIQEFVR